MYLREIGYKDRSKKDRSKFFLLTVLLALIIPALLAACGEAATPLPGVAAPPSTATPTAPTGAASSSTAARTTTAAAATSAVTQTATPASTLADTTTAAPTASTTAASTVNPADYHPIIRFSSDTVATGESITVSGEGYPARAKLNILLGPQGGKVQPDSATTADASGKFISKVFFVTYPDGTVVKPGKTTIAVATEDGKVRAGANITVLEGSAGRVSPVKLIQDFFATFKTDPQAAQAYLGSGLQAQIKQGKTSLPLLLGVQNVPESVSVTAVAGKDNLFDVYENFQNGKQYIQMEVAGDTGGKLKITNIIIPNPPPVPANSTECSLLL